MSKAATAVKGEERVIINVALANDGEPRRIFVGFNGSDFEIERGKDVAVPRGVLEVLDHAVMGVTETDPSDPAKQTIVERKRFGYSIIGVVQ